MEMHERVIKSRIRELQRQIKNCGEEIEALQAELAAINKSNESSTCADCAQVENCKSEEYHGNYC